MCRLVRATGSDCMSLRGLRRTHWHAVDQATFRARWEAEAADARNRLDREMITIATGFLLPIWDRLPRDDVRVRRIAEAGGRSLLGRMVPAHGLGRLAADFGVATVPALTVDELIAAAGNPEGVPLPVPGRTRLHRALVNGSNRLELRDYPPDRCEWLKSLGCFTEIIQYRTRLFVPLERTGQILATIIAGHTHHRIGTALRNGRPSEAISRRACP